MPRPKVDRVARSIRLPADIDELVVREAEDTGLSVNQTVELALRMYLACVLDPAPR